MKNGVIYIGGLMITLMAGFGAYNYAPKKDGVLWHTQGNVIKHKDVDTYEKTLAYAKKIGMVGIERFGPVYGCSYTEMFIGPWIIKAQDDLAITAHARGYNTNGIGLMLGRTDCEEFNKAAMANARRRFIQLNDEHHFKFSLFHSDVTKGKTDPHEFKPWLIKLGMIFDSREEGKRVNVPLREPDLSWKKF